MEDETVIMSYEVVDEILRSTLSLFTKNENRNLNVFFGHLQSMNSKREEEKLVQNSTIKRDLPVSRFGSELVTR